MAYLAPIHKPSSIRHALKLNLFGDDQDEVLVLAKANRVEIWQLSPQGQLVQLHSKSIYGRVSMLEKLRPFGATCDHLFIGTARFQYFTVVWNPTMRDFDTVQSFVDITEKHMQDSQSRDRCVVDPTGQVLVMELFQGILSLVKVLKPRKGKSDYLEIPEQVRITELKVKASSFLYTETKRPKLAILYDAGKRGSADIRLATYRVVDEKNNVSTFHHNRDRENDIGDLDAGASHLIPIPKGTVEQKRYIVRNTATAKAQLGGVIVVGETKMTYLDDESKVVIDCALDEANIWVAWERYDGLNYLLADNYARLFLLTINVDGAIVTGMKVREIGPSTKATVLVNLGDNYLFIASHEGDSQVIRLDITQNSSTLELVQTISNVAPILDFTVMDMGGRDGEGANEYSSGQARVVTASGVWEGGSLRSMRSGVGLDDYGILAEIEGIRGLFSLRSSESVAHTDILVISLDFETRLFKFDTIGGIEEIEKHRSLVLDVHTLLARNLLNNYLLQVTSSAVLLAQGDNLVARWKPPAGHIITNASANDRFLLLSSNGVTLVTLDLQQRLREFAVQNFENDEQVACIHVPSQISDIGVVGFWKSGSISVLNLTNLLILCSEDLRRTNNASIPRNIILTQVLPKRLSGPTLFVAMEDGIVLTFNVDKTNYSLSGRKSIVLGTQEARFEELPREDGLFNVFATCEHPSLIYGSSEGRIVYSAVTAESATHVCFFDNEQWPNSVIVATAQDVKICQIDTERRTHVRPLHIGETVRRIAYSPNERAFGLGCIIRELQNGAEIVRSTFRLVEEVNFGEIGKPYVFENDSRVEEQIECLIRAELHAPGEEGDVHERFIIGTSCENLGAPAPTNPNGRIHIFGVDKSRIPYLIKSLDLKGACRVLAVMGTGKDTMIVAGLTKTVVIYNYSQTGPQGADLTKVATYRTSTCPISLDVTGSLIAVGDMMKSVSIIEYTPRKLDTTADGASGAAANARPAGGGGNTLNEVGRHMQALWSTAVIHIGDDSYLVADHNGNLVVLRRNLKGVTREDRKRLEVTSELNLGEVANKIVPISVQPSASATVIPRAFIATSDGSVYLFSTIAPSAQDLLMRLQARMSGIIVTLGDLDFNTYRRLRLQSVEHEEPFRFVDGELIERFLDVGEEVQEEICKGLGPSVEDMRNLVEELKRLH